MFKQVKFCSNSIYSIPDGTTLPNGLLEIVAPSLFLLVLIVILFQCGDWCRKNFKDPQDVLDKPVDVEEGKSDGAVGLIDQAADQVNRATGY